jgi:hypothetical protein
LIFFHTWICAAHLDLNVCGENGQGFITAENDYSLAFPMTVLACFVAEILPIFSGLNVWRWFPDASVNYALHAVKLPSTKEKL